MIASLSIALLCTVVFVLRQEYPDFACRVANRLIPLAVLLERPDRRERRHEEWAAEIQAVQSRPTTATGLAWVLSLITTYSIRRVAALVDPLWATTSLSLLLILDLPATQTASLAVGLFAGHVGFRVAMLSQWYRHRWTTTTSVPHLRLGSARVALGLVVVFFAAVAAVATWRAGPVGLVVGMLLLICLATMDRCAEWRQSIWGFDPVP